MVSAFNVASLFKVNLVPGSGADGAKVTQAELVKVRKICAQVKREIPDTSAVSELVERENAFVQHYEVEISPQRQERTERT